jgi:poly(3-hydroxyalkanoate) synthetase
MLDWGEPQDEKKSLNLDDYIKRINRAIDEINEPVVLAGYCMGGLMAISAALQDQDKLKGLALLATPWDFHSSDNERMLFSTPDIEKFAKMLSGLETVPKELIYLMFYFLDPWPVHSKYSTPKDGEDFLAREYWVHDGIEMATKVAEDAFINWPCYNTPAEGKWQSLGKTINPSDLKIPTFIGVPAYDRVVPPLCAKPLTELIKNATLASSPSGHVGMIVGKNARQHLWEPLANWLDSL